MFAYKKLGCYNISITNSLHFMLFFTKRINKIKKNNDNPSLFLIAKVNLHNNIKKGTMTYHGQTSLYVRQCYSNEHNHKTKF